MSHKYFKTIAIEKFVLVDVQRQFIRSNVKCTLHLYDLLKISCFIIINVWRSLKIQLWARSDWWSANFYVPSYEHTFCSSEAWYLSDDCVKYYGLLKYRNGDILRESI